MINGDIYMWLQVMFIIGRVAQPIIKMMNVEPYLFRGFMDAKMSEILRGHLLYSKLLAFCDCPTIYYIILVVFFFLKSILASKIKAVYLLPIEDRRTLLTKPLFIPNAWSFIEKWD